MNLMFCGRVPVQLLKLRLEALADEGRRASEDDNKTKTSEILSFSNGQAFNAFNRTSVKREEAPGLMNRHCRTR